MKAVQLAPSCLFVCFLLSTPALAQLPGQSAAEALRELKAAASPKPPKPPPPGQKKPKEQRDAERAQYAAALVAAAAQARAFQTAFSSDPNLPTARKIEVSSLLKAVRAGDASRETEALELANDFVADVRNLRRDRYIIASTVKNWAVEKRGLTERAAVFAEYEKNAEELFADFSDVPDVYHLFLGLARNAPTPDKARKIASDLLAKSAPPEVKDEAQAVIDRLDMPGKKLDLKFVVSNGTEFDLAKNKGTPVVIYFWGSWGDDVNKAAMAAIRAAAAETEALFIGVNLDASPTAQHTALDGQPPPGPQHWTPIGINGPVPRQLRLNQVPSVYVFDVEGVLQGFGHPRTLAALLATAGAEPNAANP